jgi:hypothetical protein
MRLLGRRPRTQVVAGPDSEYALGMSTKRWALGLFQDPLIHYWRVTGFAVARTTAPKTLCGLDVAFGRYVVPTARPTCWMCKHHMRLSERRANAVGW